MATAIVTGAGGGLGRSFALRLARDGFAVAVLDIDGAAATETADFIVGAGGMARPDTIDLRDTDAIDRAVRSAEVTLGPLKALVNNAAVFPAGPFLESTREAFDDVVAVNQRAYYFAARAAAPLMQASGGGSIVNLGSITQHGGWEGMAAYVSTKGAAAALTRALATELGPLGIRVNCVAPGAFPTRAEQVHPDREAYERRVIESQALKRRGTFEELASVVAFLCGDESSFVTGQTINVDGGWVMA